MPSSFKLVVSEFPDLVRAMDEAKRNVSASLAVEVAPLTTRAIERTPVRTGATRAAWQQHPTETARGRGEALRNPLPHAGYVHPSGNPTTIEEMTAADIAETAPSIAESLSIAAVRAFGG